MNVRKRDKPEEEKQMSLECFEQLIAAKKELNDILSFMYIPYCKRENIDVMALKLSIAQAERHLKAAKAAVCTE